MIRSLAAHVIEKRFTQLLEKRSFPSFKRGLGTLRGMENDTNGRGSPTGYMGAGPAVGESQIGSGVAGHLKPRIDAQAVAVDFRPRRFLHLPDRCRLSDLRDYRQLRPDHRGRRGFGLT